MTLRTLDSRDGLTRQVVTSTSDFELAALASLMREAWAADYVDSLRLDFNEDHLHHMMTGSAWFAVLVTADDGHPVGFEIAMQRTLYCREQQLQVFLASAFAVSSRQRRRGIGRWVLEGINQVAFEERGADLLFSSFHHGAAGSPTVQATFDRIEGFAVNRFHTFPSWGRRIDKEPLPPMEAPVSVARLQHSAGDSNWEARAQAGSGSVSVPDLDLFTQTVRARYDVAYAPQASFRDYFLDANSCEAGALWYDFGEGATCFVCYSLTPLIVNERVLRPTGMIHAVHAENCQPAHFEQLLVHLAHRFLEQGCFAMTLYDVGIFPHDVLKKLGLQSDDRFYYAVRGPREVIDRFSEVSPPFFLDFS